MTEREFRLKYPHSTDEQVRLYAEAVALEAASPKPVLEPDIPMPMVTVPISRIPTRTVPDNIPQATSYSAEHPVLSALIRGVPPADLATGGSMRDILLGFKNSGLSPEQRQQFQHMSDEDMLAMFFDPQMFRPEAWH